MDYQVSPRSVAGDVANVQRNRLDLRALTAEAFGYSALRRYELPDGPARTTNGGQFQDIKSGQLVAPTQTGLLGLPVFCSVKFSFAAQTADLRELELLDPIITVGQPINIVKTTIQGRRGTVKEYIGQGDYAVTLRGILATDPFSDNRMAYPLPQVTAMRELVNLGESLPVTGHLLDVFNIHNLVIEDARYESLPGFQNLQAYELQCLSDEPIELIL